VKPKLWRQNWDDITGEAPGRGSGKDRHAETGQTLQNMRGIMEEPIMDKIDFMIWKWCDEHRPDLAKPGSWYKDGGIHEKIKALVDAIQGEA